MKDPNSLLIIKEGRADVFCEVLGHLAQWCRHRGQEAYVRNSPDGYEIYAVDQKPKPQPMPAPAKDDTRPYGEL